MDLPVGADVWHLDEDNQQYTKEANGLVRLRLYNAPVGVPDPSGWRFRDLTLSQAADGSFTSPLDVPFGAHLAATGSAPALVTLRNEDGVTLTLGLATIDGAAPDAVSGQLAGNAVTYPAITGATAVTTPTASAVTPTNTLLPMPTATVTTSVTPSITSTLPMTAPITISTTVPTVMLTATAGMAPTIAASSAPTTGPDMALRLTSEGLDARFTFDSPGQAGPITFALMPDTRAKLALDSTGAIRVTRAITNYTDNGQPDVTTQTEFFLDAPTALDASGRPAAVGPVSMALTTLPDGRPGLSLSVDSAWLHDPARVYPVHIDLPIITALSAVHSGWFGTVNRCAPDACAPQTEMVVGADGACTYHGLLSFDTSVIQRTTIVSAVLHLYTPAQTSQTGVQVFQNVPPSGLSLVDPLASVGSSASSWMSPAYQHVLAQVHTPSVQTELRAELRHHHPGDPWPPLIQQFATLMPQAERTMQARFKALGNLPAAWDRPTWNTAPPILAGTAGLAQSGSDGHWQSWDVTSMVRHWARDPRMSNGLTLQSAGAPVRFASPLGSGEDAPALAPYLEITYGPGPAAMNRPATTGGYRFGFAAKDFIPNCNSEFCTDPNNPAPPHVELAEWVPIWFGAEYIRIQATIDCNGNFPGQNVPGESTNVEGELENAAQFGLTPIVDIVPNSNCLGIKAWSYSTATFGAYLSQFYFGNNPIYIEAGNEPNETQYQYTDNGMFDYPNYEEWIALWAVINQSTYHFPVIILSGGMAIPTSTNPDGSVCHDQYDNVGSNYAIANLSTAVTQPLWANVGVAMHPYHYNTDEETSLGATTAWLNYYGNTYQPGMLQPYGLSSYGDNQYAGTCSDLLDMWNLWRIGMSQWQFVFTEDNWNEALPKGNIGDCYAAYADNGCEGTYMIDFINYVLNKGWTTQTQWPPLLIMWDTTTDFAGKIPGVGLGIWTSSGGEKTTAVLECYEISYLEGQATQLSSIFGSMATGTGKACYSVPPGPG